MTETTKPASAPDALKPAMPAAKPHVEPAKPALQAAADPHHYEGKVEYPKWVNGELAHNADEERTIRAKHKA